MIEVSVTTGRTYEPDNCVFFRNIYQSTFYIANGCPIQDVFVDGENKLVFVFDKSDHRKYMRMWMDNKDGQARA